LTIAFGGPAGYTGKDLKHAHEAFAISEADYEIFVNHYETCLK